MFLNNDIKVLRSAEQFRQKCDGQDFDAGGIPCRPSLKTKKTFGVRQALWARFKLPLGTRFVSSPPLSIRWRGCYGFLHDRAVFKN